MNNLKAKLSTSTKIGYGVGQLGSGLAYNLFYYYFIYFMTSFAGVSPAAAGTISLFAVIWDAVTDPMVGFLSDSLKIKTGTPRRLMMKASVPLGITVFLLFSSFNFAADGIKIFYYAVVNILFWLFFTMCDIPHITLGQELTEDYDEKSSIRGFSSGFMYAVELVVSGATMILVNRCSSEVTGWRVVAIVTAVLCCFAYFTAGVCTKGKELTISETEAKSNTVSIASFSERKGDRLAAIRTLYEQQKYMYDHRCHIVPDGSSVSVSRFCAPLCGARPASPRSSERNWTSVW